MKKRFIKVWQILFIALFIVVALTIVFYADISAFFVSAGGTQSESAELAKNAEISA